jgi:transposase
MKTKRRFTDEFKAEAVGLLEKSGKSLSSVARELDLAPPVLRSWREVARGQAGGAVRPMRNAPAGLCSPADLASENARLRAENARLEMHNQILKKAIVVVGADPK